MATEVWFLELAQKGHTLSWVRESFFKGAPKRLSLLFLHMSSHQRACPAEVPTDDGNTSAVTGPQLHLSPLKPKNTEQRGVRARRMQARLELTFLKTAAARWSSGGLPESALLWADREYRAVNSRNAG